MDTEDMYIYDMDRKDMDNVSPRMPPCQKLKLNPCTLNRDQVTGTAIEMVSHSTKSLGPCLAPTKFTENSSP